MKRRGFTLVELLVVLGIMVLLMAITLPAIKSTMRNNNQKQAVNQITTLIANARAQALQRGKICGVVFFEESTGNIRHTAVQFIAEDPNQQQYAPTLNRVFIALTNDRQYLPTGVRMGAFTDDAVVPIITGDTPRSRVVLFDSKGQLILHSGIAAPATAEYADWKLAAPADFDTDPITGQNIPSLKGVSSPGFIVYNTTEYNEKGFTAATQAQAAQWIQQHADPIVINAYTGNVIR